MPSLVIKDLSPELHRRLKEEAERHHRSMTRQALVLLEQALGQSGLPATRQPPEPIDPGVAHDHEWVYAAIREGRR